jgi:hypothetical protein
MCNSSRKRRPTLAGMLANRRELYVRPVLDPYMRATWREAQAASAISAAGN